MTRLVIPVQKLAWASDWHLNFLQPKARDEFLERVAKTDADAFVVTGDKVNASF